MRRFGEPVREDVSYRRRPGAYAVILHGQRMLLTWQAGLHNEYQLPGGGIDPGESPVQALHREVFEETGYRVRVVRRLGAYTRFAFMPEYDFWAQKICHIYLCTPGRRLGPPPEPEHAPRWMPANVAVAELASSGDRHFADLWHDALRGTGALPLRRSG